MSEETKYRDSADYPPQDPIRIGLRGRCPRCGQGRMFSGVLNLTDRCANCALDYEFADSADGPAVFAILIVGFVVAGSALLFELAYEPPFWLHLILWAPLTIVLSLIILRPLKGLAVALQYVNRAKEGEIDHR
ncbi:MAG TPA: DUF983 domain-containing protein [Afifellaceae bacterium]|nr:DUF983 domain-containing protein [Afifellaceae bacterium]